MSIQESVLNQPHNQFVAAADDILLSDIIHEIQRVDAQPAWHVIIHHADGNWSAINIKRLLDIYHSAPDSHANWTVGDLGRELTRVEAVDINDMGTGAAQARARRSPGKLLVVTWHGVLVGILFEGRMRSGNRTASDTSRQDHAKQDPTAPPAPVPGGADASNVSFTAFYPQNIEAEKMYPLRTYAHIQAVLDNIMAEIRSNLEHFGGEMPNSRSSRDTIALQPGTEITIVLECDGLTFEPASITQPWQPDYVRFDFTFSVPASRISDLLVGSVLVQVRNIEISRISFAMNVVENRTTTTPSTEADFAGETKNPLALAEMSFASSKIYQSIFVSYSRKDSQVVENYRLAQLALGNDVFMDTYSIRSGEHWQVALAQAIRNADVFQLFWSEHSAASPNVKDEWDFALKFCCTDNQCVGFIRPVYWIKPMPVSPPAELAHINFRFVQFDVDK